MRWAAGLAGLLGLWALVASTGWVNPAFMATPTEAWKAVAAQAHEGTLSADLRATLWRVSWGVGIACAAGLPLGLLLGWNRKVYAVVEGGFDFLRSIPPIVVYPLCIFMFDINDPSRVAVVVFGCTTVLVMQVAAGVATVPSARIHAVRLMGGGPLQLLRHVVVPQILPHLFVALRTVVSLGLIIVIVTEMLVGAEHGVGVRVVNAQMAYRTDELYGETVLIGLVGFAANHLLTWFERRIVHWQP